jgi:PEP-CTERM motif
MKKLAVLTALVFGILVAIPARATNLLGTTVLGDLSIDGSANAFILGSGVQATVGTGVEFTYVGAAFTYTANFTDNLLIITDTCNTKLVKCIVAGNAGGTYELSFFDEQFAKNFIVTTSTADGLGLFGFRTARDITFIGQMSNFNATSTFAFVPIPTPEPGSVILLGTGVLGVAGMIRRRLS